MGTAPGARRRTPSPSRAAVEGWRVLRADPGDGFDFNDVLLRRAVA